MSIPLFLRESDQARFWANVGLPDHNGCMLWTGSLNSSGYGTLSIRNTKVAAHRLALWWAVGNPSSAKYEAAHSCRNRHCVAPAHLRWATRQQNVDDKRRDGTTNSGDRNPQRKLSSTEVRTIKARLKAGESQAAIASDFCVVRQSINAIALGNRWSDVEAPSTDGPTTPEERFSTVMRSLRERSGCSQAELARRLLDSGINLHPSAVMRIEQSVRVLRLNEAVAIAAVLGFSLADVLGGAS